MVCHTVPRKCLFRRQLTAFQRIGHATPRILPSNKGDSQWSTNLASTIILPSHRNIHILSARVYHTTRLFFSIVSVNGMFSLRTSGKASSYMDAWFSMATRAAPSSSFWRCALMAGLISNLLGGGGAQATTSSLSSLAALPTSSVSSVAVISTSSLSSLATLSTMATPTVNALTASTTYTPTNSWTPQPTCSSGSTAVGGLGGGVYLDGYGTYWSVACGQDWSGTTFYDGVGYAYVPWCASWS